MLINRFRRVLFKRKLSKVILSANWLEMEHVNQDENDFIGKKSPRRFPKSSRRLKIKKKGIKNSLYEAGIHGQQFSIIELEFNILV